MKKLPLFAIILSLLSFSCTKKNIEIDPRNPLIGVWNYSNFNKNSQVFLRSSKFSDNPGYKFETGGTLLERKNSGFCGTPPISYSDYPGTWTVLNDTLIRIDVGYWGGSATYNLDIEEVGCDSLKIRIISASEK
jgi:hypothetical protein